MSTLRPDIMAGASTFVLKTKTTLKSLAKDVRLCFYPNPIISLFQENLDKCTYADFIMSKSKTIERDFLLDGVPQQIVTRSNIRQSRISQEDIVFTRGENSRSLCQDPFNQSNYFLSTSDFAKILTAE